MRPSASFFSRSSAPGSSRRSPETEEVRPYFRAADIFAFTSHIEAFSRTILEAEAFGLPIVTTPCCGIHEQVRAEVNGLLFEMSDARSLAQHIATLLDDDDRRIWMGRNSRKVFDYLQTYEEMLERYERLILGAWMRGSLEGGFDAGYWLSPSSDSKGRSE